MPDTFEIPNLDITGEIPIDFFRVIDLEDEEEIEEAILHLLSVGADIEKRDEMGRTPLMRAYMARNYDIAEMLIRAGADQAAHDKYFKMVVKYAWENATWLETNRILINMALNGIGVYLKTRREPDGHIKAIATAHDYFVDLCRNLDEGNGNRFAELIDTGRKYITIVTDLETCGEKHEFTTTRPISKDKVKEEVRKGLVYYVYKNNVVNVSEWGFEKDEHTGQTMIRIARENKKPFSISLEAYKAAFEKVIDLTLQGKINDKAAFRHNLFEQLYLQSDEYKAEQKELEAKRLQEIEARKQQEEAREQQEKIRELDVAINSLVRYGIPHARNSFEQLMDKFDTAAKTLSSLIEISKSASGRSREGAVKENKKTEFANRRQNIAKDISHTSAALAGKRDEYTAFFKSENVAERVAAIQQVFDEGDYVKAERKLTKFRQILTDMTSWGEQEVTPFYSHYLQEKEGKLLEDITFLGNASNAQQKQQNARELHELDERRRKEQPKQALRGEEQQPLAVPEKREYHHSPKSGKLKEVETIEEQRVANYLVESDHARHYANDKQKDREKELLGQRLGRLKGSYLAFKDAGKEFKFEPDQKYQLLQLLTKTLRQIGDRPIPEGKEDSRNECQKALMPMSNALVHRYRSFFGDNPLIKEKDLVNAIGSILRYVSDWHDHEPGQPAPKMSSNKLTNNTIRLRNEGYRPDEYLEDIIRVGGEVLEIVNSIGKNELLPAVLGNEALQARLSIIRECTSLQKGSDTITHCGLTKQQVGGAPFAQIRNATLHNRDDLPENFIGSLVRDISALPILIANCEQQLERIRLYYVCGNIASTIFPGEPQRVEALAHAIAESLKTEKEVRLRFQLPDGSLNPESFVMKTNPQIRGLTEQVRNNGQNLAQAVENFINPARVAAM